MIKTHNGSYPSSYPSTCDPLFIQTFSMQGTHTALGIGVELAVFVKESEFFIQTYSPVDAGVPDPAPIVLSLHVSVLTESIAVDGGTVGKVWWVIAAAKKGTARVSDISYLSTSSVAMWGHHRKGARVLWSTFITISKY